MRYGEVLLQINSDPVGILLKSKFRGDILTLIFAVIGGTLSQRRQAVD